jgi:predicted Zn-dependent protease
VAHFAGRLRTTPANAAGIIRDAETEALLRDYAKPIFNAAGLGAQGIKIHIVNDRAFNAFVVDGLTCSFAGLIIAPDTGQGDPRIAHEYCHIPEAFGAAETQVAGSVAALMLQHRSRGHGGGVATSVGRTTQHGGTWVAAAAFIGARLSANQNPPPIRPAFRS